MDSATKPDTRASRSSRLKVVRTSSHSGLWPWRKASYMVYEEQDDGTRKVILTGRFRGHKEALWKARDLA